MCLFLISGHRDLSGYEGVISGEAETLDVLTFVQEHMNNGWVMCVQAVEAMYSVS